MAYWPDTVWLGRCACGGLVGPNVANLPHRCWLRPAWASYQSSIGVEREETLDSTGRGACCPTEAGAAQGQVCFAAALHMCK